MKRVIQKKKTDDPVLELQLTMATTSINHEYARMEYDAILDQTRREELLNYMDDCREEYLNARTELVKVSPMCIDQFEADLSYQKRSTLQQYHA